MELFELDENSDVSDLILQDTRNFFNLLVSFRKQKILKQDVPNKIQEVCGRKPCKWELKIIEENYP
jgi:hypothetical protein